jgi:hypothetical protein
MFISNDYKNFENIEIYEEFNYDKCHNGGLIYHKEGVYDNITTYDKKMFYPSIMASDDFEFPTKKGTMNNIFNIPKIGDFSYGIYNIEVKSNDENFNKIFAFSKNNYYTHYSLNFVKYYNKEYNDSIELTLLSNKYLSYKKSSLIKSSKVFNYWYTTLKKFRNELPKNKLLKRMASSAWGELQSKNLITKTEKEIESIDYGKKLNIDQNQFYLKDYYIKNNGEELYYLIDLSKPIYKYQLRLKSFLTSYTRNMMALIALKNIDNVVRIQIDSITYDIQIKINEMEFIKEEEKSGNNFEVKGNLLIKL